MVVNRNVQDTIYCENLYQKMITYFDNIMFIYQYRKLYIYIILYGCLISLWFGLQYIQKIEKIFISLLERDGEIYKSAYIF